MKLPSIDLPKKRYDDVLNVFPGATVEDRKASYLDWLESAVDGHVEVMKSMASLIVEEVEIEG